jgi:hypothetical protein
VDSRGVGQITEDVMATTCNKDPEWLVFIFFTMQQVNKMCFD